MTQEIDGADQDFDVDESTPSLRGNIESFESGILSGWAADDRSDAPLAISIVCEGQVIGQGVADLYRDDLKDAGINEGNHAFSIPVGSFPIVSQTTEVTIIEADNLQVIDHAPFEVKRPGNLTALVQSISNGSISLFISSDSELGSFSLILYDEDNEITRVEVDSKEKEWQTHIQIPISMVDGNKHLLKIGMVGYPFILAEEVVQVNPIQTPWEYLKESYRNPGFLSLKPEADHRYESLTLQLESIYSGLNKAQTPEQILAAHSVVIEGHENRKRFPGLTLPSCAEPKVSIILPAYNKFELTYHCLASICLAYNKTSFEVILADDCSSDKTQDAEQVVENLVVSRNEENLRFLLSCNKASELAKGQYIVFLNNDTEVTSYWLDELVNKMDKDPSIGMTGSKLLNLDGSLQEAGGIVWGNGQPWNVGRNSNAYSPEYNYAREVDYLTGAAMCIRASIWEQVHRFSVELAPCYYEDTDLAFKVREAGFKTVYTPHSMVVHFEGKSHGTDVTKGLKRYQMVNEKTFRGKWFHAYKNGTLPSMAALSTEKDRNVDQRILVIDYATPMPNKDAGSYAAVQEIKLMQALGFKVTFAPENLAHFGKYTADLQRMGVEVLYSPFYVSVDDVLRKRLSEMDAVYITRYGVAEKYIETIRAASNAKIIFNNADLHFLRQMRKALAQNRDEQALQEAMEVRKNELEVCKKVDAVLCYNATEHAVITSHIMESDKLHITPWVLEHKATGPVFNQSKGISFLGGYNHHPNVEAVEYLANEVMPLLEKERPDIKLYVYGSNMPESFIEYQSANIEIVGFAESLDDVFCNHRIFVAPLLSGAGIKGKVLEAMSYGAPTVLSDVASEGTGLTDQISTLIASKPEEWVEAIIKLYDNENLWSKFSSNGKAIVENRYSFEHGLSEFNKIFESVDLFSTVPKGA